MKDYYGIRYKGEATVQVSESGFRRTLPLRLDVVNHSPSGFEWGYLGSGPSQLAFAILCESFGMEIGLHHYQAFKRDIIANLPHDEWTIAGAEIDAWRQRQETLAVEVPA